jgi:hypothetical protein
MMGKAATTPTTKPPPTPTPKATTAASSTMQASPTAPATVGNSSTGSPNLNSITTTTYYANRTTPTPSITPSISPNQAAAAQGPGTREHPPRVCPTLKWPTWGNPLTLMMKRMMPRNPERKEWQRITRVGDSASMKKTISSLSNL